MYFAKDATSRSIDIEVLDSASTTGGRKTGLVFNTASFTAYYHRQGGSATAITLVTLAAANSAFSSGGFKEIDATNMPGVYRLDIPDAALATGADYVTITLKGAAGAAQVSHLLKLTPINSDALSIDGSGRVDVCKVAGTTQTAGDLAALINTVDDLIDTEIAAIKTKTDFLPSVTAGAAGGLFIAGTNAATTVTTAFTTTFTGNVTGSVASVTAAVTLPTIPADWITAAGIAADAIGSSELAAGAVTKIQTGLSTLDAAGIRSAVGLASANLDTQLTTIDDLLDTEIAAIFNRIGAPAGASVSADVAAIKAETVTILADTNDLQTRLPAALTAAGNIMADTVAIDGQPDAADRLQRAAQTMPTATIGAASTTTNIVTSGIDPSAGVTDQFKGRLLVFAKDTTTSNLRGQASDITASTAAGVLTVVALTTAPVSGDTAMIV